MLPNDKRGNGAGGIGPGQHSFKGRKDSKCLMRPLRNDYLEKLGYRRGSEDRSRSNHYFSLNRVVYNEHTSARIFISPFRSLERGAANILHLLSTLLQRTIWLQSAQSINPQEPKDPKRRRQRRDRHIRFRSPQPPFMRCILQWESLSRYLCSKTK